METNQRLTIRRAKQEPFRDSLTAEGDAETFNTLNTTSRVRGSNSKTTTDPKLLSAKWKKEPDIKDLQLRSPKPLINKCDIGLGEPPKGHHSSRIPTLTTGTQNMDNVPLRKPVKLAPLDLPTEIKEAQLLRMRAGEDLLDKQKDSNQVARETPTKRAVKTDPFNKAASAQTTLPKLKKDQSASKGTLAVDLVDSPLPLHLEQENIQGEPCTSSTLKLRSSLINNSLPCNASLRSSDAEMFVKSRFRHLAKQSENQSRSKPVRAICLDMDFSKRMAGIQIERNHRGERASTLSKTQ